MFKFLKEKLQNWTEKVKEEFSEKPIEKKKEKKSKTKKEKEEKPEKLVHVSQREKVIEIEEPKKETEKKGFFKKLFSKEERETSEKILEDAKKEQEIQSPETRLEKEVSFFDKFKKKLTEEKLEELFVELEMILLQNNVAYEAVQKIKQDLSKELIGKNLSEINLKEKLKESIENILIEPSNLVQEIKNKIKEKKPYVIIFVGINGSGKTTSIAKVASMLKKNKLSVCMAAADTFRAAAIEQLETHAKKIEVPIIKKDYGADPASVGFEAIAYAKKHSIDVVLVDTAGRMNTKESLMKEMEKISRVCNPDMKIFLGESVTGNDATEQARAFNEHINIDGIILSKADIDEKGGTALSVSFVTKKPIYFLGTGQKYEDLEEFNKKNTLKRLGLE